MLLELCVTELEDVAADKQCLSVCVCMSMYLYVCLSVCLPVCLSVCMSVCMCVGRWLRCCWNSASLSSRTWQLTSDVCLSVSVRLCTCMSLSLSVCLSVCMSVCMCVGRWLRCCWNSASLSLRTWQLTSRQFVVWLSQSSRNHLIPTQMISHSLALHVFLVHTSIL